MLKLIKSMTPMQRSQFVYFASGSARLPAIPIDGQRTRFRIDVR
jgi:hypothetical protein